MQTLLGVIGEEVSEAEARRLLQACGDSVERAANRFYDQQGSDSVAAPSTHRASATATARGSKLKRAAPAQKGSPGKASKSQKKERDAAQSTGQKSIMAFMHSPEKVSSSAKQPAAHKNNRFKVQDKGANASELLPAPSSSAAQCAPAANENDGSQPVPDLQQEQQVIDMTNDCEGGLGRGRQYREAHSSHQRAQGCAPEQQLEAPVATGLSAAEPAATITSSPHASEGMTGPMVRSVKEASQWIHQGPLSQTAGVSETECGAAEAPSRTLPDSDERCEDKLDGQVHSGGGCVADSVGGELGRDQVKSEDSGKTKQPAVLGGVGGQSDNDSTAPEDLPVLLPLERCAFFPLVCFSRWPPAPCRGATEQPPTEQLHLTQMNRHSQYAISLVCTRCKAHKSAVQAAAVRKQRAFWQWQAS